MSAQQQAVPGPRGQERLLLAAAQLPVLLLFPGVFLALLPRENVTFGGVAAAVGISLLAVGALILAPRAQQTLVRPANRRSVLLSACVVHVPLLVLLVTAIDWVAGPAATGLGAGIIVAALACAAGLTAPFLPGALRTVGINRLTLTAAVIVIAINALIPSSAGLLMTSAVLTAFAVPLVVMRLPPGAENPG